MSSSDIPQTQTQTAPTLIVTLTTEQLAAIVREQVEAALEQHTEGAPSADALIDTAGCAQRLGVSLPTFRKMDLPHVMCGEHRRYHWPTVLEHLRAQRGAR